MPTADWLVAAGLACNLILAAFTYGRMTESVGELKRRVEILEVWRERVTITLLQPRGGSNVSD